jgi:hypothetical protein
MSTRSTTITSDWWLTKWFAVRDNLDVTADMVATRPVWHFNRLPARYVRPWTCFT